MSIGTYNPQVQPWDGTRRINPNDWNNLVYNVTGSQLKSGSFEVDGPVYISGPLIVSGSTNIGLSATVNVQNTGIIAGARGTINLLSGSGISLTVADNPSNNSVDINIGTGSGVGGGGVSQAYSTIQNQGGAGLTPRNTLNLIGTTISAIDDSVNSRTNITVASYGTSNPTNLTVAASPSTGISSQLARSDHFHGSPTTWTPSIHSSTHAAGGTDPVTGSLTLASLTTGNITGNNLTSSGSISTQGAMSITGSLLQSGSAHIANTLLTDQLATFLNGITSTGSNILTTISTNSIILTGSLTGSGIITAGNITVNNIT